MKNVFAPALLPTATVGSWSVTSLRDSLIRELNENITADTLQMFFYAITTSGWLEIKKAVLQWLKKKKNRNILIYVGTDHALTDPTALEQMHKEGIQIQLMSSYSGVFHPKLIWMSGKNEHSVWIGSNNLTRDGLLNNIEFAALIKCSTFPTDLSSWVNSITPGSIALSKDLLASYKNERKRYEKNIASSKTDPFVWSKKKEPQNKSNHSATSVSSGDLIIEIMPEETRGGNQIQLPIMAARSFFGLEKPGSQTKIKLRQRKSTDSHDLLITIFPNNTARISVNELEHGDRPCVIVFRKTLEQAIEFEIVSKNIFPTRYEKLINLCKNQTRTGSRRWIII